MEFTRPSRPLKTNPRRKKEELTVLGLCHSTFLPPPPVFLLLSNWTVFYPFSVLHHFLGAYDRQQTVHLFLILGHIKYLPSVSGPDDCDFVHQSFSLTTHYHSFLKYVFPGRGVGIVCCLIHWMRNFNDQFGRDNSSPLP